MNLIRRYLFAPFLISFLILSACEKPPHLREGIEDGDFILSFEIEGLDASETIEPILKSARRPASSAHAEQPIVDKDNFREKKEIIASKITEFKGLEARLLLQEIPLDGPSKKYSRSSMQTKGSMVRSIEKRALNNMSPNKRYRVLIFNTNTAGEATTYVNQSQGIVGSPLKIPVYRNKTYRWFAYSYNREEDLPAINSTGYNVPVTANLDSAENDFLYSTGLIKTSSVVNGENPISITFSRQLARIRLEINARGVFATVNSADVDVVASNSGLKNGLFSLLNGSYNSTSNVNMLNYRTWNPVISDTVPLNWAVYRDFYTAANSSVMRLSLKINEIIVTSERINDNAPNTKSKIPRTFQNIDFTFPDFIAKPGHRYQALLELLESPIKRGTVYWARGNLYYDESVDRNKYRFRYDNPHIRNINNGIHNIGDSDYWYGGITPHAPPTEQADPCKMVYPEGLWRLPTGDEYRSLINSTDPEVIRRNQLRNEGWYISWDNASNIGAPRHPHGHLIFTALGNKDANGYLQMFDYKAGNTVTTTWWPFGERPEYGDTGYFRTSAINNYFVMNYRRSTGNTNLRLLVSTNRNNIAAPIRCVRKVAPNLS